MDFTLSEVQESYRSRGTALGRNLGVSPAAADVIAGAARVGVIDARADLLATAAAVEALAFESAPAAVTLALHAGVVLALGQDDRFSSLTRGETVGAIALSTDDLPSGRDGRLTGRASLVGPLTDHGVAVVGARSGEALTAFAVSLDTPGVSVEIIQTSALSGFRCGFVNFEDAASTLIGPTVPFMTRIRTLLATAGVGMGRRALHEALRAHGHRDRGAGGEQTVQGLLADAATELDAALVLIWKAASPGTLSLADASMAKLAATEAALRAVARATQVVGVDSFRQDHVVDRLSRDVRALELFAGRTEALREAIAWEILPRT